MITPLSSQPSSQFCQQVHDALRAWSDPPDVRSTLSTLRLVEIELSKGAANLRRATNNVLLNALNALTATHDQEAEVLRLHFLDDMNVHMLANRFNISEPSVYRWQAKAMSRLSQVLLEMERRAVDERVSALHARLEAPSSMRLFGVQETLNHLLPALLSKEAPWVIAISGIGGIGKTSLADAAVRAVIRHRPGGEIAWLSAKQYRLDSTGRLHPYASPASTIEAIVDGLVRQLLPGVPKFSSAAQAVEALRAHLAHQPSLIVIDNLETISELDALFPWLNQLANPTKFLLTSRQNLFGEPMIHHVPMGLLSEADAFSLVRQDATHPTLASLSDASDDVLRPIYHVVGGNPLALRLVAGQAHMHALDEVLNDLRGARSAPAEMLYHFIYRAAWDRLGELSRRVLLAMPLIIEQGGSLAQMATLTELHPGALNSALAELVILNLVDVHGVLTSRHYSIHPLTQSFLLEQVLKW